MKIDDEYPASNAESVTVVCGCRVSVVGMQVNAGPRRDAVQALKNVVI